MRRARQLGLLDDEAVGQLLDYYRAPGLHLPLAQAVRHFGINEVGFALVSDGALPLHHRIAPHLTLLELVGQGAMGAVWKAHDAKLNRVVAVKLLKGETGRSAALLRRFEREGKAMARVDHPGCVPVFEVGLSARTGEPYLVMPLVRGRSLADLMTQSEAPLEVERVVRWCRDVARALHACHEQGLIHRDVKPSNILIDRQGRALLSDFGIVRDVETAEQLTDAGALVGTLSYMPPEQLSGGEVDARSDIYALGATLHEALTGRKAFVAERLAGYVAQITSALPTPLRALRPDAPGRLEAVVLRSLAKDPRARLETAAAFADELEAILDARAPEAAPVGAGRGRRLRARDWAIGFVAGALVALGVSWARAEGPTATQSPEPASGPARSDYVLLRDEKEPGHDGGDSLAGEWATRDLTVERADTGGHCILTGNRFTLAPGTYELRASAPAHYALRHQARLYDVTDSSVTLLGTTEFAGNGSIGWQTRSWIQGRLRIASTRTFEIQHRCQARHPGSGFGVAAGFATEVYTVVELVRVAP